MIGQFERGLCGPTRMNVAVEIGPGQCENQRSIGMSISPGKDGGMTTTGVKSHTNIVVTTVVPTSHVDTKTEIAQEAGPSGCRDPVSPPGSAGRRGDEIDLHDWSAQVLNPTQISLRSGVWKFR